MRKMLWVLLAGAWAGNAAAVNTDDYKIAYAGVSGLYEISDSARDSGNGYGFHLNAGLPLAGHPNSAVELSYYSLRRDRDVDDKADYQQGLLANYVYDFAPHRRSDTDSLLRYVPAFTPYALGGLGVIREDVRGDDHYHFGVDAGGGLLWPLPYHGLAVRSEAVAVAQINDRSADSRDVLVDYQLRLGLQLPLSFLYPDHRPAVPAAAECPVEVVDPAGARADCQVDSDRDGVVDSLDQCPGTASGTAVDGRGCPAAWSDAR